jgi:putative hemolysin
LGSFVDIRRILRDLGVPLELGERSVAWIERTLAIDRLDEVCTGAGVTRANGGVPRQIRAVFVRAGIDYEVREAAGSGLARPAGPLIFYCNHPFGIADALVALEYALDRRPDTKVLANSMLSAFDVNDEHIIWVDLDADHVRDAVNQRGLRRALKHLRNGGALLIFPAGECSHLYLRRARITDPEWSQHLSRLIAASGAMAVPVYFEGRNSWRFHALGLLHPLLRTLMLVREFIGLKGHRIRATVGPAIEGAQLAACGSAEAATAYLRRAVYALADPSQTSR